MEYFEMIEDYLENNLSSEDRYAFVEELTKNELLQKEVHKHQIAYAVIEQSIEESLRKKLEALSKKSEAKEDDGFQYGYLIIIGLVILSLLTLLYFLR